MIAKITEDLIYYHAPKCGSRTVLAWNALIRDPNLYIKNPMFFKESNRKEYGNIRAYMVKHPLSKPSWSDVRNVPNIDAKIKFCIVRDPVDRFVSGFVNRILFHNRLDNNEIISITEFIERFQEITKSNASINEHFKPQCHFYGINPDIFTHIFSINEMDKVKALIENETGLSFPMFKLQQNGGIEKPSLTEEQKEWIRNKYQRDYDIFGSWM